MCALTYQEWDRSAASPLRALHSLTETQVARLEGALARLPGSWSLDRHEGYDGHLTLLVTAAGDDSTSFSLHRTGQELHLSLWQGDEPTRSGTFLSVEEVARVIGTHALDGTLGHPPLAAA